MEEKIRQFVEEATGRTVPSPDADLITSGVIDSFSMMQVIGFLQRECGAALDMEALTPENFHSIRQMSEWVQKTQKGLPVS